MDTLERKIDDLIKKKGVRKSDFLLEIGMSNSGFNDTLKNGSIKVSILEKIAKYFSVPITYFFEDEGEYKLAPDKDTSQKYIEHLENEVKFYRDLLIKKTSQIAGCFLALVQLLNL